MLILLVQLGNVKKTKESNLFRQNSRTKNKNWSKLFG